MSTSFERLHKEHQPASSEVFLDTSIHCSLLKGPLFTDRIRQVFRLFRWKSTSTYAKVEFGNVVLAQAEYYLRKLDKYKSLAKARDFIGNVLPHRFHGKKVTWSFNLLDAEGMDDAERTERATLSLRRLMKLGVAFVEEQCDKPIQDGTGCHCAKMGVRRTRGRLTWEPPDCKRDAKRCRIDEFFTENREAFQRIKAAIDSMPADAKKSDQLKAFSDVIEKALHDPGILLDYQNGCRKLADALIAVDGRKYRNMFSQNVEESDLLTSALGQAFYYLPPNPEKGVLVKAGQKSQE